MRDGADSSREYGGVGEDESENVKVGEDTELEVLAGENTILEDLKLPTGAENVSVARMTAEVVVGMWEDTEEELFSNCPPQT